MLIAVHVFVSGKVQGVGYRFSTLGKARQYCQGNLFIAAYRTLPGIKWIGDRTYEQIRDNRYNWFGKRDSTYHSSYPIGCNSEENCSN